LGDDERKKTEEKKNCKRGREIEEGGEKRGEVEEGGKKRMTIARK
jgi:hypothetical protein